MKTLAEKAWHQTEARLEIRADGDTLPPGIAGRVSGIALTYDVVDSYGTMFAPGSAKRTIEGRVSKRKVPLLMDHDRSVASHVGVVASMSDVGDALVMTAELFDTPDGRAALEYVRAVIAAGASTGFSIGFIPRASARVMVDGQPVERFTEIELREVSLTPMPAVPGADVTSARRDPDDVPDAPDAPATDDEPPAEAVRDDVTLLRIAAETALRALPAVVRADVLHQFRVDRQPMLHPEPAVRVSHAAPPSAEPDATPAPSAPLVSLEDRVHAVRRSFHVTH